MQGTPTTVNDLDGRIEVLSRGTDDRLYDVWQIAPNAGWSGFWSLGGQISGDPTAVRNRDGRLELFAPLPDGTPGDIWQTTRRRWLVGLGAVHRRDHPVARRHQQRRRPPGAVPAGHDNAIYRNIQLV